jgi:EmrB/QacA subfamily drug resistance transporter
MAGSPGAVRRPRAALLVLCAASFLAVVDTTIVTIALPTIRNALGLTAGGAAWVLNSYALVFGGLLLLSGRLGDRWGRRRLFLVGLVVFGVASALAAAAAAPWLLLVARVGQGLGAAAFVPNSLSLLTATFLESGARSRALSAYGAMAGVGFVAGMVGGGVITQVWGWRWIFWLNLPLVAGLLLLARRSLPERRGPQARGPVDLAGAVSGTLGLAAVLYGVTAAPERGWWSWQVVGGLLLGGLALVVFLLVERRHGEPLVPPSVLVQREVAAPNVAIALLSMVGVAWLYLLTVYLQDLRSLGPLISGVAFAPMTVASVAGAALAGRLVPRLGARRLATIGLLMLLAGLAMMTLAVPATGGLPGVLAGMVVGETGFMLSSVSLTLASTSALSDEQAGLTAGLVNTATQLGGGFGLGVVAAVVAAVSSPPAAPGLQAGFVSCLVFVAGALLIARRVDPTGRRHPPPPVEQVTSREKGSSS